MVCGDRSERHGGQRSEAHSRGVCHRIRHHLRSRKPWRVRAIPSARPAPEAATAFLLASLRNTPRLVKSGRQCRFGRERRARMMVSTPSVSEPPKFRTLIKISVTISSRFAEHRCCGAIFLFDSFTARSTAAGSSPLPPAEGQLDCGEESSGLVSARSASASTCRLVKFWRDFFSINTTSMRCSS